MPPKRSRKGTTTGPAPPSIKAASSARASGSKAAASKTKASSKAVTKKATPKAAAKNGKGKSKSNGKGRGKQKEEFLSEPSSRSPSPATASDPTTLSNNDLNPFHLDANLDPLDPLTLPFNVHHRRTSHLKALEIGGYADALRDVVSENLDLGTVLLEWEAITAALRKRDGDLDEEEPAGEEEEQEESEDDAFDTPAQSPSPSAPNDGPAATPAERQLPKQRLSSNLLTQMTRWPLPPTPSSSATVSPPSLSSTVESLLSAHLFKLRRAEASNEGRPKRKPKTVIRSLYEPSAPFAAAGTEEELDEEEDEEGDTSSLIDSDLDSEHPEETITSVLDNVLDGMAELVPKGPLPATDYWSWKKFQAGRKKEAAMGWEAVCGVVEGMEGVSDRVAKKLKETMESIYGPAREVPQSKQTTATPPPPPAAQPRGRRSRSTSRHGTPRRVRSTSASTTGSAGGSTPKPTRGRRTNRRVKAPVPTELPPSALSKEFVDSSDEESSADDAEGGGKVTPRPTRPSAAAEASGKKRKASPAKEARSPKRAKSLQAPPLPPLPDDSDRPPFPSATPPPHEEVLSTTSGSSHVSNDVVMEDSV